MSPKSGMKKIKKKFEKSSNTFQKTLDVTKKKFIRPETFSKVCWKEGQKKQKGLKGSPKKCTKESCNIIKYSKWWQWKFIPIKKYPKECQKRFPKKNHKEMLKKSAKKVLKRVTKKGFKKKFKKKWEKKDLKKCK